MSGYQSRKVLQPWGDWKTVPAEKMVGRWKIIFLFAKKLQRFTTGSIPRFNKTILQSGVRHAGGAAILKSLTTCSLFLRRSWFFWRKISNPKKLRQCRLLFVLIMKKADAQFTLCVLQAAESFFAIRLRRIRISKVGLANLPSADSNLYAQNSISHTFTATFRPPWM